MAKSIHTAQYRTLVAMLRAARTKAGLTQTEVARRLGKPQSYVAKYEAGERRLDVIELLGLLTVLGQEPNTFVRQLVAKFKAH